MDVAIPHSLDEAVDWAPFFVAAIAAIVVGIALLADELAEAFRDWRARRWAILRRLIMSGHAVRIPAIDEIRYARRHAAQFARRPADSEMMPQRIDSRRRRYTLANQLGSGDLADLYSATADGQEYVVKIARPRAAGLLPLAEARWLSMLALMSGGRSYRDYFPCLLESVSARIGGETRHVNVFEHTPGFFTLEAVRERYPAGLDARHLAWVFKRMLAALGFAHACGLVHGAVLPPHVMIHAENHGLQLLDWIHAAPIGRQLEILPAAYRDWYPREALDGEPTGPATDIYLAAKCLIYLAGGNPIADRWPAIVPEPLRRFVDTCLYPAARMRPQDAWKLHEEFDELLLRLFGPPKYHPLVMT